MIKIPKGANVTYIDLDAQRVEEVITGGWTDDQIKAKSIEQINELLSQAKTVLKILEDNVSEQRTRVYDLEAILNRKIFVGDN
jgi:hypothetical protein